MSQLLLDLRPNAGDLALPLDARPQPLLADRWRRSLAAVQAESIGLGEAGRLTPAKRGGKIGQRHSREGGLEDFVFPALP
jgi:hypothetical protein